MLPVPHIPSGAPIDRCRFSIVMQGALSDGNLVETATYCQHWRSLFPDAELILSLSGTNAISGLVRDGLIAIPRLVPRLRSDSQLDAALKAIVDACDKLAMQSDGLPLPPIKADTAKLNNINLQIAAAQNGLKHATRMHVLRVRSDFVFLDRTFIDQYETMSALPRGPRSILSDRVMISWLYTLNPYTHERLPLHFSDWFNFGRLSDVRALWDVPFVQLADAVHYITNPHPASANRAERLFNIRIADEQHLMLHAMRKHIPDLKLETLVDNDMLDVGMDILADNFCLCDLVQAKTYFPKYQFELTNPEKLTHCLTPADWLLMVQNRGVDYKITLAHKIAAARNLRVFEGQQGFPRSYGARCLFSKVGVHVNGEIVSTSPTGTLVFGPHISIPTGRYRATVNTTNLEGSGAIVLRATLEHGVQQLAERRVEIWPSSDRNLTLDFEVTEAKAKDFEVVVDIEGMRSVAIASIVITERDTARSFPHHHPIETALRQLMRHQPLDEIDEENQRWRKLGEIAALRPGNYRASLNILSSDGIGRIRIRLTTDGGRTFLAEEATEIDRANAPLRLSLPFSIAASKPLDVQIHCHATDFSELEIGGILFTQREPDFLEQSTYYYTAAALQTRVGHLADNQIVASAVSGVLSYGPYISLPPGNYSARPILSRLEGRGTLTMAATADVGARRLGGIEYKSRSAAALPPALHFSVNDPGAKHVELTCSIRGFKELALDGILISRHASCPHG